MGLRATCLLSEMIGDSKILLSGWYLVYAKFRALSCCPWWTQYATVICELTKSSIFIYLTVLGKLVAAPLESKKVKFGMLVSQCMHGSWTYLRKELLNHLALIWSAILNLKLIWPNLLLWNSKISLVCMYATMMKYSTRLLIWLDSLFSRILTF